MTFSKFSQGHNAALAPVRASWHAKGEASVRACIDVSAAPVDCQLSLCLLPAGYGPRAVMVRFGIPQAGLCFCFTAHQVRRRLALSTSPHFNCSNMSVLACLSLQLVFSAAVSRRRWHTAKRSSVSCLSDVIPLVVALLSRRSFQCNTHACVCGV